jgi:hypothetical protein
MKRPRLVINTHQTQAALNNNRRKRRGFEKYIYYPFILTNSMEQSSS